MEDADEVRRVLLDQVEQVARRLRKHRLWARGISLKIRYGDFETISRSTTLEVPTDATGELWQAAQGIFDHWAGAAYQPVRLIGMTNENLSSGEGQLNLFAQPERERHRRVDEATDRIVQKFGNSAIKGGGTMG